MIGTMEAYHAFLSHRQGGILNKAQFRSKKRIKKLVKIFLVDIFLTIV